MMVFSRKRFLSIDGAFTKRWFTLKLNTKQQEVQQICRRIAEEDLKPNAAYFDKNALFPQTQLKNLADNGFLRAIANPKNQGLGLDMLSLAVGVEELSRGCASTGFLVAIHNALFVNLLETRGSEEQQRVFLRESPRDKLGSFALSEPDAGSDVASIKTTATRGTDAWILNGEKCWVTNAPEADAMITFATTDKELKHNGLTCFIVPLNFEGVSIGEKEGTLGVRAISTCTVKLKDVHVPMTYQIGKDGEGFNIAMAQLDQARIGVSAHAIGIAQAAFDTAIKYATERQSFGRSLYRIPAVQDRLADMHIQIESARLLVHKAATEFSTSNSALAKYVSGRCATSVSDHCVQILGGMGISTKMDAERHYRDARGTQIYGGVSDVQKMIIGRQIISSYLRTNKQS